MRKSDYLEVGINIKELVPSRAVHPGELLRDVLKAKGFTQKRFAEMTGIQPTQLNEVIKEKRGMNAEMAIKIGDALKMDAIIWAKFQMTYELDLARIKQKKEKQEQSKKLKSKLHNTSKVSTR
jgi:HTH-type transcriptional regulator/antitoxin HigA